jgi:predicted phage-related endonuclease
VRFRKREPGLVLPIPADLVARWQAIKEEKKKIEEAEDEAKAAVLAAMSEAEIGESEAGNVKVLKVELNRLDTKALKAEHPDIAAKFTMASESIRVTFTKAKLLKG